MASSSDAARLFALRFLVQQGEDAQHDEESSTTGQQPPWGDVILASLIVQTVTLTGLILSSTMACCGNKQNASSSPSSFWKMVTSLIIPSFAGGALLATTIFLIIPEALHLVPLIATTSTAAEEDHAAEEADDHAAEQEHDDHRYRYLQEEDVHVEPDQPWKVGTAILAGFLFPMFFWIVFPGHHHHGFEENPMACIEQEKQIVECQECQQQQNDPGHAINQTPSTAAPSSSSSPADTMATTRSNELKMAAGASSEDEYNDDYEYNDDKEPVPFPSPPNMATGAAAAGAAAQENDKVDEKNESCSVTKVAKAATTTSNSRKPINYTLAASILVGDFFHNFTDGVFLGSAFSLCNRELGYTLVASTVYHELAQEVADYFLLIHHCHLYQWEALALNFVAGFSVMIGALLVLAMDMTDTSKGIVLALSAGVYLHIAASECVPRAQSQCQTSKDALVFLLCFILGAIPIGLVLLNHGHCEAEEAGHEEH